MSVMKPEKARDGLRVWLLALLAAVVGVAIAGSEVREAGAVPGTCTLSASAYSVTEGSVLNIPVLRTGGTTDANVAYLFSGGTAPTSDYSPLAGAITIFGSDTSKNIVMTAVNNAAMDGSRTVNITIDDSVPPACALVGTTMAVITINDDDGPQQSVVTDVTPSSDNIAGGVEVIITGSNFTGADCPDDVTFDGVMATACTVNSDTMITATAPPHAADTVNVQVDNDEGLGPSAANAANEFIYFNGPVVHDVTPPSAPAGQNTAGIVIAGAGFLGTDCDPSGGLGVEFGAVDAVSCVVNNDNQITATAPSQPISTVNVRVTNGAISPDTPDDDFSYTGNVPVVTSIVANSGPLVGGNVVTVNGQFLTGATSVMFGTQAGTSVVVAGNGNSLTVTVPTGVALGTVNVQVTTPSGSSSTAGTGDDYTYTAAPTITGINPDEGPTGGGTIVQIAGTNLFGVNSVTFGGINATAFTIVSGILINATAPAHALGLVDVRVSNVIGTSPNTVADDYEYIGGPNITSVTPTGGPIVGGTIVQIKGSGFTGTTAVKFGTTDATNYTVVNDTTINATAPAHAKGVVHIRVSAPGGTSPEVNADRFTYGEPTVTDVSPESGPKTGGNFVTVSGSNFTGATAVRFGNTASPLFDVTDDMSIVVEVPAGSGTVHVTVVTPAGTSATHDDDRYTYNALPTITNLNPTTGPAAGGNNVILTGSDFTGATNVLFGTKAAAGFTVNSDTQITAVAPSGTPGTVDVRAVTPKGTSPTSAATKYTYQGAGGTNLYSLAFRWNLITWAGPNGIDIIVALQSLDNNAQTNSIWDFVTAVYTYQNPDWKRFFPNGVNIPGANNLQVFTYGFAYWIALSQAINWTTPQGP